MLSISIIIIILVIGFIPQKMSFILLNRIGSFITLFSAILSYNSYYPVIINSGLGIYNSLWQISSINTGITTFIYIIGGIVLLLGEGSLKGKLVLEQPLIIMLSIMGMICLISSYDLISFFLAIELQSLSLYVLATIYKESESATSAGLKYFLLGGLSSGFILLGSSLLYGLTGITNFEAFSMINPFMNGLNSDQINLALLILAIGLLFKIAAAPFHNWAPDVYDGVPTIITSWLAILPKISIIILMVEFYYNIFNGFSISQNLFILSAFLSLFIGSVLGLAQYRIKRLLTYSAIAHIGFLLLALGINSHQSIDSLIFYLIQYTLTSVNIFYILIVFGYVIPSSSSLIGVIYSPIQTLSQLKAQFKYNPLLGLCFAISLFSMAGIPPCIGFFAKFLVLLTAASKGFYFLVLIAIITSVISAVYYLKLIRIIHFDKPIFDGNIEKSTETQNLIYSHSQVIAILTLIITFFILHPTPILNIIHLISLSFFY